MKEILEKIFDKKFEYAEFDQAVDIYYSKDVDGEINHIEANSYEPRYRIKFDGEPETILTLSELIVMIFNLKV